MSALTLICIACDGSGREPLGAITVKCHVCKGAGEVPRPGVASELPAPPFTLEDAMRQIRQLQRAVLMLAQVDPPPSLAAKRAIAQTIQAQLEKSGGMG